MTVNAGENRSWEAAFLAELSKTGNVSAACRKAKISRTIAYRYRDESEEFAAKWLDSIETATDELEAEAWRRAVRGVRRPVGWYKGMPGGYIQEYSDTLLVLLLKANRPDKFRENVDVTSGGEKLQFHIKLNGDEND